MKTQTLLACVAVAGLAICNTACASDVHVGVGVGVGINLGGRDGISLRIGVNDRPRYCPPPVVVVPPRCEPPVVVLPPRREPPVVVLPPRCEPPVVVLPPRCEPPVVVVPPPCQPPVVIVEPCHAPIQVTITEIVDYRDERYIAGYSKGVERVWDRACRRWNYVDVQVPVWKIRRVPVTVTRVVTADWYNDRGCYGYTDRQGCFQRVER